MKTPIDVKDIRAGDLIRWESPDGEDAHETRISNPRHTGFTPGRHYLLDRPTPAVEFPTEPTLGWVEDGRHPRLAHWSVTNRGLHLQSSLGMDGIALCTSRQTHVKNVTAFTPATAVPTEALEELRRRLDLHKADACIASSATVAFLAAVDGAK